MINDTIRLCLGTCNSFQMTWFDMSCQILKFILLSESHVLILSFIRTCHLIKFRISNNIYVPKQAIKEKEKRNLRKYKQYLWSYILKTESNALILVIVCSLCLIIPALGLGLNMWSKEIYNVLPLRICLLVCVCVYNVCVCV